ncbi:MAG: putative membrane protein, partial [Zhongshania sp.]
RLIPRAVRHWRASNLARRQFLEQNLHHTKGETGMLIFVSEAERYVEILVDRGISAKIPDVYWETMVNRFTARVAKNETAQGFIECIESCGEELQRHIPASGEKNELPNHLIILD